MTAQAGEGLIYKGKETWMRSEPLAGYLAQRRDVNFSAPSTACWRGYVGTWEIKQGISGDYGLYLIELVAHLEDYSEVGLAYLFPEAGKEGVFAHWFTGDLSCPQGELLEYVHMGYASVYESDLFLSFNKGILVSEKTFKNDLNNNKTNLR